MSLKCTLVPVKSQRSGSHRLLEFVIVFFSVALCLFMGFHSYLVQIQSIRWRCVTQHSQVKRSISHLSFQIFFMSAPRPRFYLTDSFRIWHKYNLWDSMCHIWHKYNPWGDDVTRTISRSKCQKSSSTDLSFFHVCCWPMMTKGSSYSNLWTICLVWKYMHGL